MIIGMQIVYICKCIHAYTAEYVYGPDHRVHAVCVLYASMGLRAREHTPPHIYIFFCIWVDMGGGSCTAGCVADGGGYGWGDGSGMGLNCKWSSDHCFASTMCLVLHTVCGCVYVRIHVYSHTFVCVCVCVCV